ncbi:MAG: family 20 glycosylhydrolase, partial [Prevotellaceae bacterium]|nr:family 20 glycosylhydrolase [Prevotellaceae bacterium]
YETYAALDVKPTMDASDILPAVKQVVKGEGTVQVPGTVALAYPEALANEAGLLGEKLSQLYNVEIADEASMTVRLKLLPDSASTWKEEQYRLQVSDSEITIEGVTPHGVFNGTQTLLALLKGDNPRRELARQTIVDYPDLTYRGAMVDIARNFTPLAQLKKLVDILASYKLDRLHLHVTDDEGWRLEIPGLEELTQVGSRRGHTLDESDRLYPCYDGGFDPTAPTTGNGYYTREEFIDLLKFATQRHIEVITEIESPGHGRAAIVSMKARYNKYAAKDKEKAEEYLLSDVEDTSEYESAQAYRDNIINVAMPSAYRFMEKVITEVEAMYKEAGAPLTTIHLGGDEVPEGAWAGSPLCREFMAANGMQDTHELMEYFYCRMSEFMAARGLKIGGWQEAVLHNKPATDEQLRKTSGGIYCWNTVAEWQGDEIPYKVANNGYPVVMCNVNCFYLDLSYNDHFDERGLSWGGHVDESKSFSALPFSIYRSARTGLRGNKVNLDSIAKGKVPLLEPQNIIGVQAQLFAEAIRGYDWVEYQFFPKVLGLVERAWNVHPAWETEHGAKEEAMFNADLSRFYGVINSKELPYWKSLDVNFRLPNPGLMMKDGYLYANTPLPDVVIHYTLDGTEPGQHSAVWTIPVKCDPEVVKARASHLGKVSVVSVLKNR